MSRLSWFVVVALALLAASPTFAAQFVPLSSLVAGAKVSEVRGVSNDGSTVIGAYSMDGVTGRAFRWELGVGLVELLRPNLQPINGLTIAVSADGSKILGVDADVGPFLWTEGIGTQYLNLFATERYDVQDMSADGSVIVGNVERKRPGPLGDYYEAFRWSAADGFTILNSVPASNDGHPYARGISDDGSTIVGSHDFRNPDHTHNTDYAFRWTESGGTVNLGTLNGTSQSVAIETSEDGAVILGDTNGESFRWSQPKGFQALGMYPSGWSGGGLAYFGSDITAAGDLIVGSAQLSDVIQDREPIIWDEVRHFRSLRTILNTAIGTPLTGWDDLGIAYAVSADGTVIVGSGVPNGAMQDQGWVMLFDPVEIDPPQGDYNRDGTVDAADYIVWRNLLGELVEPCSGPDANCNGFVDNTDYRTWRSDYGRSVVSGRAAADERQRDVTANVPEPALMTFYLIVAAWVASTRSVR